MRNLRNFGAVAFHFLMLCCVVSRAGAQEARAQELTPTTSAIAEPALPQIPEKTFPVTEYGAKGDGKTKDTAAIATALDAAEQAGGGVVKFPAGTYLTGAIKLRSKVALHVEKDATIR